MTQFAYCADQVRQFDHDRYITTLFATPEQRHILWTLYAFNSEVARIRESTTDVMTGLIRLQWWRDAIDALPSEVPKKHPAIEALHTIYGDHPFTPDYFHQILEAREQDLERESFTTMDELITYAEHSCSTLLLLTLESTNASDAIKKAAHHIGIAWSLMGHLRSIHFHMQQSHIFFPDDILHKHHTTPEGLLDGTHAEVIPLLAREIADVIIQQLDSIPSLSKAECKAHMPLLLLQHMIARYLKILQKQDYDIIHQKVEVSPLSKMLGCYGHALKRRYF